LFCGLRYATTKQSTTKPQLLAALGINMKKTLRFQSLEVSEDEMVLTSAGVECGAKFSGRSIEQQFEVMSNYLLLIEGDPTALVIILVTPDGAILDKKTIGNFYLDSMLENVKVVSDSILEFDFGAPVKLEVKSPESLIWVIDLNGTPEYA
jgi:hypothetical protein